MSSAVPTLKVVSGLEMSMLLARHPPQQPTLAAVVFVSWLLCCCVLSFFSGLDLRGKKARIRGNVMSGGPMKTKGLNKDSTLRRKILGEDK